MTGRRRPCRAAGARSVTTRAIYPRHPARRREAPPAGVQRRATRADRDRALVESPDGWRFHSNRLWEVSRRLGQDSRYWLDSSAIRRDVGWQPEITLEAGLRDMVEWGRAYLPQLAGMSTDYVLRT